MEPLLGNRTRFRHRTILMRLEEELVPPIYWNLPGWPQLPERPQQPMPKKSTRVTLEKVLENPKYVGKQLEYHYDFGDGWEHSIEKIGTELGNVVIKCVAGTSHGVAEYCVGTEEWKELNCVYKKVLKQRIEKME